MTRQNGPIQEVALGSSRVLVQPRELVAWIMSIVCFAYACGGWTTKTETNTAGLQTQVAAMQAQLSAMQKDQKDDIAAVRSENKAMAVNIGILLERTSRPAPIFQKQP